MIFCCEVFDKSTILEYIFTGATVLIAFMNLVFIAYIFLHDKKKSDRKEIEDRNIMWFNKLILDHNLKYFYEVLNELEGLFEKPLSENTDKFEYLETINDQFIRLNRSFVSILDVVDHDLYKLVLNECDKLQSLLNTNIADEGNNLAHDPKFNELIRKPLSESKISIMKCLYNYRG